MCLLLFKNWGATAKNRVSQGQTQCLQLLWDSPGFRGIQAFPGKYLDIEKFSVIIETLKLWIIAALTHHINAPCMIQTWSMITFNNNLYSCCLTELQCHIRQQGFFKHGLKWIDLKLKMKTAIHFSLLTLFFWKEKVNQCLCCLADQGSSRWHTHPQALGNACVRALLHWLLHHSLMLGLWLLFLQ